MTMGEPNRNIMNFIQSELETCVDNFVENGYQLAGFSGDVYIENENTGALSSDEFHFIIASDKIAWFFKKIHHLVAQDDERAARIAEIIKEHLADPRFE